MCGACHAGKSMMNALANSKWQYLNTPPSTTGVLKQQLEDFQVQEILGYEPCGEGEHCYLWVKKSQLNTAFVAEALAKFAQVPLRAVSYAGRKDKYAVTEQWFGVHIPGKTSPDWSQFTLEGASVLKHIRHNKKLRTGVLKGNRFTITIRQLTASSDLEQRLTNVANNGVPNYFGEQRFGNNNSNLHLAQLMLQGEEIRNRNKRSMAISALRSWLFNQVVSERISKNLYQTILTGDAMQLSGSNSFFIELPETANSVERLSTGDINITAPLWGKGEIVSQDQAALFEQQVTQQYPDICNGLVALGLKQERRSIHLQPKDMQWKIDNDKLTVSFELPSGCFATSVMREIVSPLSENNDETTSK